MLRPRIIPVLLVCGQELVKTTSFSDAVYIGDPLNTVRIFSDKKADELFIFDIQASKTHTEIQYDLIEKMARFARMPICYGGGITEIRQVQALINRGVEKISINSGLFSSEKLINEIASHYGNQSIVASLDFKFIDNEYRLFIKSGTVALKLNLDLIFDYINRLPVGEVSFQSIDRDGHMCGYDFRLASLIRERTDLPLTCIGGAKGLLDMQSLGQKVGISGLGAGSLFVFRGRKKAVLLNYPDEG